jgi:hypothetical protein
MQIPNWAYTLLIAVVSLGSFAFLLWMLVDVLEDFFAIKNQNKFDEDLRLAIKNSQPGWEQLLAIASTRNVKNTVLFRILQKLMREILTGRETDIAPHKSTVEGYLAKIKEIEPFEGIPTEIRIHLERIKDHLPKDPMIMQPLTSQIRELLALNEKEKRHQRYYTTGGFFIGFLGLIFAAFTYFYPYSNNQAVSNSSQPSAVDYTALKKP